MKVSDKKAGEYCRSVNGELFGLRKNGNKNCLTVTKKEDDGNWKNGVCKKDFHFICKTNSECHYNILRNLF